MLVRWGDLGCPASVARCIYGTLTDVHPTCHPFPLTYGDLGSGTEDTKGKVSRDKNWGDQVR